MGGSDEQNKNDLDYIQKTYWMEWTF